MSAALVVGLLTLATWIYLLLARGAFWRAGERDDGRFPAPERWPAVAAVIPARNEAESIAQTVEALCRQDYPGELRIFVVDDQSEDGTAALARAAAAAAGRAERVRVLPAPPLARGWTGKVWAQRHGIDAACAGAAPPEWLLLTDADIAHAPDGVRRLVERALGDGRVMVTLMARLQCDAFFERALIPAFVLFFQMLYPFAWVNRREHRLGAAAGGCMLISRAALQAAGGIASIRHEIIDDCALGARMKTQGAIWLGLTSRALSVRPYGGLGELRRMVARTAYAQLRYSPVLLAGTVAGLLLTFIAPPALTLLAGGAARATAALAWAGMTLAFQPMLRFYRRSPLWGPFLPLIAALYLAFTIDSAVQHWRGRGGMWKGRAQAALDRQADRQDRAVD
jgi:hopene-associated glycosyltransferase HpnB